MNSGMLLEHPIPEVITESFGSIPSSARAPDMAES
jgi:hypothetical protein